MWIRLSASNPSINLLPNVQLMLSPISSVESVHQLRLLQSHLALHYRHGEDEHRLLLIMLDLKMVRSDEDGLSNVENSVYVQRVTTQAAAISLKVLR